MTNKVSKHYSLDKTITFDDDTNERIEDMFNELTEEKYEIEATNISSIKKADLETELDRSFVNQLVSYNYQFHYKNEFRQKFDFGRLQFRKS